MASLSLLLLEHLAQTIAKELKTASLGHCLRVDHLTAMDAEKVCKLLRSKLKADTLAYLLSLELKNEIQILPEKAIEIRNRKEHKLCIFIPTGKIDSTASSLVNSFASFDLETCFESIAKNLLTELPREIREIVKQIRTVLTGQTEPTAEKWVDYLSTIAQNPTFESTGLEMWRIGLIPDLSGSSLVERLDINKQSVDLLARPRRAQTSIEERLESLKLKKGGVKDQLFTYFKGRRLRELSWLERLSQEPYKGELTFERWSFESLGTSDLEAIEVLPFVDFSGQVEIYTGLRQPNGQGTQPIATVGTKAKVTVKWNSVPSSPENLAHWQAELVTAREDSQGDLFEVELPKTKVSAKVRRASLSLDIDVETLRSRAVQIKVIGLDENGNQLRNIERIPIEGYSTEFWLSDEQISLSEIPIKHKRDTLQSLPYGRLKTAVQTQIDQIQESAGEWDERELSYYNVTINSRKIVRIGMSPILKILEQEVIRNPDDAGLYFAKIDSSEKLKPLEDIVKTDPSPLWFTDAGANFLKKRRELFKAFSLQATSGLVETADLNKDIVRKIKNYNQSYRELLTNSSKEILPLALAIDTLHIEIVHTEKVSEPAVIVMPTHPLRLFWYAAYTELLQHWQAEILKIKTSKERSRLIDLELVSRVAPLNWPAFIYSVKGDSFLFVQNLRFFWGVGLPLGVKDPARLAADVAMTVGLQETEASLADLPPTRITDELKAYRKIHPYLETLKVALINPGSGSFAAEALRHLYISNNEENSTVPARLEITAYTYQPLPLTLEPLAELQKQLYDEQPKGRYNQLSPLCVIAVRDSETIEASANDVNVTLATDQVTPKLSAISNVDFGDSSSLHGLLIRFLPHFQSNEAEAVWNHLLNFPLDSPRERHPVASYYTNSLVDSQRDYLSAMAKLVTPATDQTLAITARLSTQERSRVNSLHHLSDWVITLDRFFGVEFYDNPMDENLKRVAQQYLLDYSPEFLEGLGHRMLVTTSHREEIEEIMSRAMKQLGFSLIEVSVKTILNRLKAISGRLALRVFGDDKKAKEVVSLGIVACYLHSCGDLEDSIIIPVDSHPELFGSKAKHRLEETERPRCDILQINFHRNRLIATFIEVKYRSESINTPSEKFLDRIVDQIEATENVFRDLFFKINPVRIDHVLQRSRLVAILRFYLYRSWRYGLIRTKQRLKELDEVISKLESGIPDFKAERKGFVLNLKGSKESLSWRNTEIKILTSDELVEAGLVANLEPSLEDLEKKSIQEEFIAPVEIKAKPIVTEQSVTRKDFAENIEVALGVGQNGQQVCWHASVRGNPHLFILGIPGQGKSVTVTHLLREMSIQNLPSIVIDFHGQFVDPRNHYVSGCQPKIINAAEGLPFSPFENEPFTTDSPNFWSINCFTISEIVQYVCELGDIQRDIFYDALRKCYQDLGFDTGKAKTLPKLADIFRSIEEHEVAKRVKNVASRCRPLFEFGLFLDLAETKTDLYNLIKKGLVVDLSRLHLETLQMAAGAFLLRKIYKDMFHWGETNKLRFAIVLDEAHRLSKDITLPKIMKEGRKFGILVITASQGLGDFHQDVVDNVGSRIIFRTNYPISRKIAKSLKISKSIDLATEIEQLDVGYAYVKTPEMSVPQKVKMFNGLY